MTDEAHSDNAPSNTNKKHINLNHVANTALHTDITHLLPKLTATLPPAHIVQCSAYSAHYCMNAIDIMDPKMDNMLHIAKATTIESAVQSNKLPPVNTLSTQQLLAVCDRLLAHEALYLYHNENLCQTVYTCMYIYDKQHQLPAGHWFTLYINLLLKQLSLQRELVQYAAVYDDDEFVLQRFDTTTFADEYSVVDLEQLYDTAIADTALDSAVQCRLQYRYAVMQIYNNLYKLQQQVEMDSNVLHIDDIYTDILDNIILAQQQLQLLQSTLSADDADVVGFDDTIAIHELVNTAHKVVKLCTKQHAVDAFRNDLQHLQYIVHRFSDTEALYFDTLLDTLTAFNTLLPHPSLVVRSGVYMLLGTNNNVLHRGVAMQQLVFRSLCTFASNALPLNADDGAAIYKEFNTVLYRMSQPAYVMLRIQCDNYSRQQRSIDTQISDFIILEDDTSTYDHMLHLDNNAYLESVRCKPIEYTHQYAPYRHPVFSYTVYHALTLCVQQLTLSLRLQLYTANELCVVYWYVDLLLTTQLQARMNAYRQPPSEKQMKTLRSGKKNKIKPADVYVWNPQLNFPPDMLYTEVQRALARAIAQLCVLLETLHVVVPTMLNMAYCNEWYLNRFDTCARLPQPTAPTLQQYVDQVQQLKTMQPAELVRMTTSSYGHAKELLSKLTQLVTHWPEHELAALKALIKVCVINSVLAVTAQKQVDKAAANKQQLRLVFKFGTHAVFATLHLESMPAARSAAVTAAGSTGTTW